MSGPEKRDLGYKSPGVGVVLTMVEQGYDPSTSVANEQGKG